MSGGEIRSFENIETVKVEILAYLKDGKSYVPRQIAAAIKFDKKATANGLLALIRESQVIRFGKIGYSRYQLASYPIEQGELEL